MLDTNQKKAKRYFIEELKKEEKGIVYLTASNVRRTDTDAEKIVYDDMKIGRASCRERV